MLLRLCLNGLCLQFSVSYEGDLLYSHSSTCRGFRSPSPSVNWPSTPSLGFIYWNHFSWQGVSGVVMVGQKGTRIHNGRYFLTWWGGEGSQVRGGGAIHPICTFRSICRKTNLHQTCHPISQYIVSLALPKFQGALLWWRSTRCHVGIEGHRMPDVAGGVTKPSEESRRGDRPSSHSELQMPIPWQVKFGEEK